MAASTPGLPQDLPICRTRGDTRPFTFVVRDSTQTAIDITGFTFRLTVDPSPAPTDATANLFTLTGTVTDGPNGRVQFALTVGQADQTPNIYFYDVEMVDLSGAITTIVKSTYQVDQDISK